MDNMLKLGRKKVSGYAAHEDKMWDEKSSSELVEISISHGEGSINSIQFTYLTGGKVLHSQAYGEPTGSNFNAVEFDYPGEVLTSISCKYLQNGRLVSITCGTNKKKYGPFGSTGSRSNEYGATSYENYHYEFGPKRFGGFHGIVRNGYVYAIGVYLKPYVANSTHPHVGNHLDTKPET